LFLTVSFCVHYAIVDREICTLSLHDALPISAALQALDKNDMETYQAAFEKTVPLARHIFQTPTYAYKTGVVFMAYLNGHQSHFRMIGGAESARSIIHLSELFVLADEAGLLSIKKWRKNGCNVCLPKQES